MQPSSSVNPEQIRLQQAAARTANWMRWGPYLSERQWGTVREDYSPDGSCWGYLPHDHARSRAYRWGEDGLLGICDREGRVNLAIALWNGQDPILKERLFGLGGPEGNHGEDVKEEYYFLESTPTHSYMKALYKYPQRAFPYDQLVQENARRSRLDPEYELVDTGIFAQNRYFDVTAEYAKASPDDILLRLTVANRSADAAILHLLPTIWLTNTWAWGRVGQEGYWPEGQINAAGNGLLEVTHPGLGALRLAVSAAPTGALPAFLFTNNATNTQRLFNTANATPYVKDAFHEYLVHGNMAAVNPSGMGSKAAAHYVLTVPASGEVSVCLRLTLIGTDTPHPDQSLDAAFDHIMVTRHMEADEFYAQHIPATLLPATQTVVRQAYASLLWSKQYYHYSVEDWLQGDPAQPAPPASRLDGRNSSWAHLYNRDVISMPDTWEYPWYAAWDLSFHMVPLSRIDPQFARDQLLLFTREWYMHPNGQLPAYEFSFSDVNPPVHAWAAWQVYRLSANQGQRDIAFLERVFQKLLINFTWWVNRKDVQGKNVFSGGFLGLDNIGIFDRSQSLPDNGVLEQADGTAWMAFYCSTMLRIALELAHSNPVYEDLASKFFEHFVAIADAMNSLGGTGLWDEEDGLYHDQLMVNGEAIPVRVHSIVGLLPLIAVNVLEYEDVERLSGFSKRLQWFLDNRPDLKNQISYLEVNDSAAHTHRLLAIPSRDRLLRVLTRLLDEDQFLSPHGVRSISLYHRDHPYSLQIDGATYQIDYEPGESTTGLFGGNSNWRGPVWFPINYLLAEALERYDHFYGTTLRVECPTGSGQMMTLHEVAQEIRRRLSALFVPDASGYCAWHGTDRRYASDPHWANLSLFHEYFHGDTGRGCGASHQTGWTALVINCFDHPAL